MMRFTKIRYKQSDRSVLLRWTETNANGDEHDHQLASKDAPRPEFVTALSALAPAAREMCECEDNSWGAALMPTGVTLGVTKDGEPTCVITCLRPVAISSAPLVLNTPHVAEDVWPGDLPNLLLRLAAEAKRYIAGERAQADMFDEEEEEQEQEEDELEHAR